jgi:hypothetical protein
VKRLEKDFDVLELQHIPREGNSTADALSASASTQAPVPEGVFQRRLLKPSAQPADLGEGGWTSTSKLAVPAALHPWCPPRVMCSLEGPKTSGSHAQFLRKVPTHGSLRSGTT